MTFRISISRRGRLLAILNRALVPQLCILDPLGKVLWMFAASLSVPMAMAFRETDAGDANLFFILAAACAVTGFVFWLIGRGRAEDLKARHASLMVIIIWFLLPLIGAIPLLAYTGGSLSDAYFEAVSGLTASGATVLSGIDGLPDSIKIWRGEMTWLGGMGLIVLAVAILPNLGVGGRQMLQSEVTGPLKNQELAPQINETAKGLWLVYTGLTLLCMGAYYVSGMDVIDAVVHSFTTLGLGGFSNHDASFAYFDSPLIEMVAVVFMVLAGFNFATHFLCLQTISSHRHRMAWKKGGGPRGRIKELLRECLARYRDDFEFRPYLTTLAFGIVLVVVSLNLATDMPFGKTLRDGIFNTVSIATTTGYSNADFYLQWPLFASFFILLLANFTSCSGSTGGGIKMIRALTTYKRLKVEQLRILHPHAFQQIKIRGSGIADDIVVSIFFFVLVYVSTILLFTLLLLAASHQDGLDMLTALSAAMACVSNTGPGLGDVGPGSNYTLLNPVATSIGALAMLLGRLEFLLFLLLFSRKLWR